MKRLLAGVPLLLPILGSPVLAQQPGEALGSTVSGVVFDANSGVRLAGARVRIQGLVRGTLTDSLGAFELSTIPPGTHLVVAEQYGFEGLGVVVDVGTGSIDALRFGLQPLPVMLEGLEVVIERLELMEKRLRARRNAAAVSTRAFGQDRLVRSASPNMLDFLRFEAFLNPVPCGRGSFSNLCILRRGSAIQPRVYIDEAPVIGGMNQLGSYSPSELYLVEVYSSGREIHAFTHQFMERMTRRPIALFPIGVG